MTNKTSEFSNEKKQEFINVVIDKCEDLGMTPEQVVEQIARLLLNATSALGVDEMTIKVEGKGDVSISIKEDET